MISVLPGDGEITEFLMRETLADAMEKDVVVIDMSSCTTEAIRQVDAFYRRHAIPLIDAPVSGGVKGAETGNLVIFASGPDEALKRAGPLFETLGCKVFGLGKCGNGKTFKNLNNFLLTANAAAVGEAFRIARAAELDLELLASVIEESSGNSVAFRRWRRMVNKDFDGGFKLSLARKDLENALAIAASPSTPRPPSKAYCACIAFFLLRVYLSMKMSITADIWNFCSIKPLSARISPYTLNSLAETTNAGCFLKIGSIRRSLPLSC